VQAGTRGRSPRSATSSTQQQLSQHFSLNLQVPQACSKMSPPSVSMRARDIVSPQHSCQPFPADRSLPPHCNVTVCSENAPTTSAPREHASVLRAHSLGAHSHGARMLGEKGARPHRHSTTSAPRCTLTPLHGPLSNTMKPILTEGHACNRPPAVL